MPCRSLPCGCEFARVACVPFARTGLALETTVVGANTCVRPSLVPHRTLRASERRGRNANGGGGTRTGGGVYFTAFIQAIYHITWCTFLRNRTEGTNLSTHVTLRSLLTVRLCIAFIRGTARASHSLKRCGRRLHASCACGAATTSTPRVQSPRLSIYRRSTMFNVRCGAVDKHRNSHATP